MHGRWHALGLVGCRVVSSAGEMASVTLELLNDPRRQEQLSHEGRRAVGELHNWDRIAELYEKECYFVTRAVDNQKVPRAPSFEPPNSAVMPFGA